VIPNPFLQQLGPQAQGLEEPTYPQIDPMAASFNAALRARELQTRMGIRSMVQGQQQSNLGRAAMLGAREGGKYLGTTLSGSTAAALGGTSMPAEAAGSAIAPAATEAGTTLAGTAGQALGVAATAYGTYQANVNAGKSLEDLHAAIEGGNLTPDQEARAREQVFRSGMSSQHLGGLGGGLAGFSIGGPVGAVVGGAAGASGGAREAWGSYDSNPERFRAVVDHMTRPWRR